MDGEIGCRWAEEADFDAVLRLSAQLARHIAEEPPALTAEAFAASHVGPAAPMKLLLAERGGQVVGLAAWTLVHELYSGDTGLYISDLVVDQAARGQGVGQVLMERVKVWARAAGVRKLGWDVWHANSSAMGFYTALGGEVNEEAVPYRMVLDKR